MPFIAVPPVPPAESLIENDGFFPGIDLAAARAAMRIDGTVTPERLREALIDAAATVNDELAAWRTTQLAAGHLHLEEAPAAALDGTSVLVHRYLRAVRSTAAANLVERMRSYDATADGHQHADRLDTTVDDLRRDAHWAINDLRGQRRTTVELI